MMSLKRFSAIRKLNARTNKGREAGDRVFICPGDHNDIKTAKMELNVLRSQFLDTKKMHRSPTDVNFSIEYQRTFLMIIQTECFGYNPN